MGWRDKAQQARTAAKEALQNDTVQHVKDVGLQELQELDLRALRDAAAASAGVANRKGDVKMWRVAKAAGNPARTAKKVARGVGGEVLRQRRHRSHSSDGEET
jgi:hypothetical protein